MLKKNKSSSIVVIDIIGSSIKICEIENFGNLKKTLVKKVGNAELPELIQDGIIKNEDEVALEISKILKENNITSVNCYMTFNSSSIVRRVIPIKNVNIDAEMKKNLIGMELTKYIPINISDYDIEYRELKNNSTNSEESSDDIVNVDVFACPKQVIMASFNTIKKANLKPLVLDLTDNAMLKFLITYGYVTNDKTFVVMELNTNNISFSIISDNEIKLNRIIEYGVSSFDTIKNKLLKINTTESLIKVLELNNLDLIKKIYLHLRGFQYMDIDEFMKTVGFSDFNVNDVFNSEQISYLDVILNNQDRFLDDIDKFVKYYTTRFQKYEIDGIYIYGYNYKIDELISKIEKIVNSKCNVLDLERAVNIGEYSIDEVMKYVNCIAATVRIN